MENTGGGPNFELPPQPPSPEGETQHEQSLEAPPARQEQVGKQLKQPALPTIPDDIQSINQTVIAAPPQDITNQTMTLTTIPDSDRISPEWVEKAKSIVARTQDDPYLQKSQMSKVKAEYIQKRFGKEIKTDEAAT